MSSVSTPQQQRNGTETASADRTAKVLANLQRVTAAPSAEAAPAAVPVMVETPAPSASQPAILPAVAPPLATGRSKRRSADLIAQTFEVAPGKGTRVLTARIPRDLHARLYLLATSNRFAENNAPATINDLVMEALHEWLERHDAA
jgi:hypothetical protein